MDNHKHLVPGKWCTCIIILPVGLSLQCPPLWNSCPCPGGPAGGLFLGTGDFPGSSEMLYRLPVAEIHCNVSETKIFKHTYICIPAFSKNPLIHLYVVYTLTCTLIVNIFIANKVNILFLSQMKKMHSACNCLVSMEC